MKKYELTEYENKLIDYIKANIDKPNFFVASIVSVAQSGMSRQIKVAIIREGEFENITYLIARVLGKKLTKRDAVSVSGCGMDMIFHLLDVFASRIGIDHPYKYAAVQHYRRF